MTPRRKKAIIDRYNGYLDKWSGLTDEAGIVQSTQLDLARETGVDKASVGPALRKMQDLGLISDLVSHQANGTSFIVAERRAS